MFNGLNVIIGEWKCEDWKLRSDWSVVGVLIKRGPAEPAEFCLKNNIDMK